MRTKSRSLTKKESKALKQLLPSNAAELISEALLQKKIKVSKRMILFILNGEYGDRHGVIEIAIKLAELEKSYKESLSKAILN